MQQIGDPVPDLIAGIDEQRRHPGFGNQIADLASADGQLAFDLGEAGRNGAKRFHAASS